VSSSVSTWLQAILVLARREILQFLRDRARVFGSLVQVGGIWLVMGFGFQGSFTAPGMAPGDMGYIDYLFPGMIILIVLFSSIFGSMSIVEDRQTGFLHAAIIAPLPRAVLAFGTMAGGTVLAFVQAALLLLAIPLTSLDPSFTEILATLGITLVVAFTFTAVGSIFAWRVKTTRGFHAVMNVLLMPLWVLSGALFPASGAHPIVRFLIQINPASYAVNALRTVLHPASLPHVGIAAFGPSLAITIATSILIFLVATFGMPRSLRTD
jgi:ABC-2 type transport system permease protein